MVYNLYAIKNKLVTMNQRLVIICLVISSMIIQAVLTIQKEYVVKTSGNSLSLLGVQIVEAARHHHKQQNTNSTDESDNETTTSDIPPAHGNTTSPGCPPGYYNPRGCVYQ